MTDTPRTDVEIKRTARIGAMSGMEQAWEDVCHFARELERENARLREATKRIVTTYDAYLRRGVNPAPMEYADVAESIERARSALEGK